MNKLFLSVIVLPILFLSWFITGSATAKINVSYEELGVFKKPIQNPIYASVYVFTPAKDRASLQKIVNVYKKRYSGVAAFQIFFFNDREKARVGGPWLGGDLSNEAMSCEIGHYIRNNGSEQFTDDLPVASTAKIASFEELCKNGNAGEGMTWDVNIYTPEKNRESLQNIVNIYKKRYASLNGFSIQFYSDRKKAQHDCGKLSDDAKSCWIGSYMFRKDIGVDELQVVRSGKKHL